MINKLLLGVLSLLLCSFNLRESIQEDLDYCLEIVYEIHEGETTQEEGLGRLEAHITMMKFHPWYCVPDLEVEQTNGEINEPCYR